ncbi:MAG: hypothetical protein GFH27_549327n57 [Chloroflexi bacterium AL-W]|nr:hypothetical protein [Chloroflexi bacterium AL-N1]NOK69669.1 hypothetical protein [Chloroflexi bacterium AL-N10]NOK72216.1 hypothetical protein [Chloroflexi bacterium AL-N5]NOK85045.1 hypothetical protein [Chloroflexi bacterium AL-W]NOK91798.1 hypothetical protein [Chloroflexi bacterium AL-N15]
MYSETHRVHIPSHPPLHTVVQFVEAQSATIPDTVAVVAAGGRHLSYGVLNQRANRLAHYLHHQGVEPETSVGVYMARSCDLIIALLAILKAGGAYAPLDLHSPQTRLRLILRDTQIPIVLTQQLLCTQLPSSNAQVVCIDTDWNTIVQERLTPSLSDIHPAQLAYIMYTSGSTGVPKGVAVSHKGLKNLIEWHQCVYNMPSVQRATHVANIAFDASFWEIWPCLASGATLCLPAEDVCMAPLALRDWLVEQAVTISFLPTPLAEAMLALPWPTDGNLTTLLTGGDRLQHYPDTRHPFTLVNHYGVTEASVVSTAGVVSARGITYAVPSIGYPIHNTHVYVLNQQYQQMPSETSGGLFIGGVGLARGYWQQPALTAERFLPDLFTTTPGRRMYDTRDTAYYQTDGTIHFLGREDQQVQMRGYRIELGEIESALVLHTAVHTSVVCLYTTEEENQQLVAYLMTTNGESPNLNELRQFLQNHLPDYMIPAIYITVESFPLTLNGKIDRTTLPDPGTLRTTEYIAPRTPLEAIIAAIWNDVLTIGPVGVLDNFFNLGGNSLQATQIVARLHQVFRLPLTVRHLLTYPTIDLLAKHMLANETQRERIEKIACAVQRLKTMSPSEKQQVLEHKRSYV